MIKSRCRIQVTSTQCTMGLSIALRISKIVKGKGPNFAQFWSKPYEAAWDRWKTAQRFRGKHIRRFFDKNVVVIGKKHDGHDWQSWNFAQGPIRTCSSKDFRATLLSVTPFRVHISSKYFHSLKPQNHMKFNSSQIFEAYPSTSLIKFLLTPLPLLIIFNLSPNIYQKWKYCQNISL